MVVPYGTFREQDGTKRESGPAGEVAGSFSLGVSPGGDTRSQPGRPGESCEEQQADAGPLLWQPRGPRRDGHGAAGRTASQQIPCWSFPGGHAASICGDRLVGSADCAGVARRASGDDGRDTAKLERLRTWQALLRRTTAALGGDVAGSITRGGCRGNSAAAFPGGGSRIFSDRRPGARAACTGAADCPGNWNQAEFEEQAGLIPQVA